LVGIDGSEDGMRAVRYGVGRVKRLDGDLWLVNAVDDGVITGGWGIIYDPGVLQEAGQAAIAQASAYAVEEGVPAQHIRTDVIIGNPSAVLAECSKQAEILIVGRRASSGLERMFVGSTSTALVAASYCPLVVISSASTPKPTGAFHAITVAAGGSGNTALRWACQEARVRQASVDVVHVIPHQPASIVNFLPATAAQERDWEQRVLAGVEQLVEPVRQQFTDVTITVRSQRGVLADELIQQSASVDMLVLGVKAKPSMMLGGPLRAILAHSACPVVLISR
jgi:nucleotide-binding universal stress UspA family protein